MTNLESYQPGATSHRRLVAIDLDGTLLGPDHAISFGNVDAVRFAMGRGATVVLASGRRHGDVAHFAHVLGLPAATPLISYNGAMVRTIDGRTLRHTPLPADHAAQVARYCADNDLHLNYYLDDTVYICRETVWADYYRSRTATVLQVVGDLGRFAGERPTKLLIIDRADIISRLYAIFSRELAGVLYVTKTEDEYLEFMALGVGKGEALQVVANDMEIPLSDCIAFGDSYNDESMLQVAGYGVAMENGREELKAMADLVAPPCGADGVGVVLKELFGGSVRRREPA